ncbi:MAG: glutamate--tRNA ligase [Candidatus Sungiibacteriota bacterium]
MHTPLNMSTPRVRFPPSPTGYLHIGNVRTALFNYLFARKHGGAIVLRIEDTDRERSKKEYEEDIFEALRWLGLDIDEGPEQGGDYVPYRQSERTPIYKKYLAQLLADGKAFYCFHSEVELEEEGKMLLAAKQPPIHACEYRDIGIAEAEELKKSKPDNIIRFKTPLERTIIFPDLIRGDVSFASDLIGDFSIAKNMDEPLYHFAVVVDDYEMKISHIIRGEDHIANTPKHILLAKALGFPIPAYAHLPLILGTDRSKLSKRHGAMALRDFRQAGYLPEALINFLALLGWNPGRPPTAGEPRPKGAGGDQEIFSKEELVQEFSLEKVQKSGAVFDVAKLDWMNGEYIRRKSLKELTQLCKPYLEDFFASSVSSRHSNILKNVGMSNGRIHDDYLEKIVALEQPRLKKLSEIGERAEFFFRTPEYDKELLRWKHMTDADLAASLARSEGILSQLGNSVSKLGIEEIFFETIGEGDKGAILWPLRVALSGRKASPGPFEIMEILGIEESLARIRAAKEKLNTIEAKPQ